MTGGPVTEQLAFSESHYLLRLQNLSLAGRGQKGYDKGETATLVKDLIAGVLDAQKQRALAVTKERAASEALKYHADDAAAARQPWELDGAPTMAIEAVVQGQQLAERHDRAANSEISRRLANADRMQREAQELLDRAKETAALGPPELELPAEPRHTKGMAASLEEQAQHLQACRAAYEAYRAEHERWEADRRAELDRQGEALDAHQVELAEQERALGERQAGFVAELDRIAEVMPAVRSTLVDLTEQSGDEPTQAMEVAS